MKVPMQLFDGALFEDNFEARCSIRVQADGLTLKETVFESRIPIEELLVQNRIGFDIELGVPRINILN